MKGDSFVSVMKRIIASNAAKKRNSLKKQCGISILTARQPSLVDLWPNSTYPTFYAWLTNRIFLLLFCTYKIAEN